MRVARYRLSGPAKADIAAILRTSGERWGTEACIRYRALLTTALRRIADDPTGQSTADRSAWMPGLRSFHIRHSRDDSPEAPVGRPVHVIFFRALQPDLVEIIRVLHERSEPGRHIAPVVSGHPR